MTFLHQIVLCSLVNWKPEEIPIVFGEKVTLFCNTSEVDGVDRLKTTWMQNTDVVVHRGVSLRPSKFAEQEESDGSSLIIINTNTEDLMANYTCLADIYRFEAKLELNESNYIGKMVT